ncbi:MAG: hypothetical protein RLO81_05065 [Fulvivirga sp.]|uniref:hypothetical protein n=1 Tax=Fulvivirga sp. TaxID=1931237 RepID=UPI0032ED6BC7
MENLKDYMLLFRMELKKDVQPTANEIAQIKKSWQDWISQIGSKARLVSSYQLGFESNLLSHHSMPEPSSEKVESKFISGNMVLKAVDLREATEFAKGCPILAAGGSVEVRNTLNAY